MPKYLVEARYTPEAVKGVMREGGSSRRAAAAKAVESVGGKLEAFYFAFGEVDAYCIVDLPDEKSAVAASMTINQSGTVSARMIALIAPETVDAATKSVGTFRAPGQ
jgi:uncharacterized protein with GYD domain